MARSCDTCSTLGLQVAIDLERRVEEREWMSGPDDEAFDARKARSRTGVYAPHPC